MHLSLDIETLGTRPGSVIRSIGACLFDPAQSDRVNAASPSFYANITHESCTDAGLTVDQSTIDWWKKQPVEARRALLDNQMSLRDALESLVAFCRIEGVRFVYGYGATFDPVLLEAAAYAVNELDRYKPLDPLADTEANGPTIVLPWAKPGGHRMVRCARTILSLAGVDLNKFPRQGQHHHALDDARTQANALRVALLKLRPAPGVQTPKATDTFTDGAGVVHHRTGPYHAPAGTLSTAEATRLVLAAQARRDEALKRGVSIAPALEDDDPDRVEGGEPVEELNRVQPEDVSRRAADDATKAY